MSDEPITCPHCHGEGETIGLDPAYVHLPGAVKKMAVLPCPTCRGETTVTAEQHAQWQEAHGDLRVRVRALERKVAALQGEPLSRLEFLVGSGQAVTSEDIDFDGHNGR